MTTVADESPSQSETSAASALAPQIGVIMGSASDWEVMREAGALLEEMAIPHECRIVSAHRTPDRLYHYAKSAKERGLRVIIAAAGGAAALPGMTAAMTTLPVFGVPIETKTLKGLDSLLSIAQMPSGVPVGTLAIGRAGAKNAALLAVAILALSDEAVARKWEAFRKRQSEEVAEAPPKKP